MPRGGHAATSLPPVISGVEGVAVAVVGRLADGLHPSEAFITVAVVVLDLLGGDGVGVSVDHDLLLPLGRRRLRRGSAASASLLVRLPESLVRGAGAADSAHGVVERARRARLGRRRVGRGQRGSSVAGLRQSSAVVAVRVVVEVVVILHRWLLLLVRLLWLVLLLLLVVCRRCRLSDCGRRGDSA